MNRRRNVNVTKTLKDYMVPIIWVLLVILLIFSVFNWGDEWDTNNQTQTENQVPLNVELDSEFTEAYVIYAGGDKKQIEDSFSLYKWETIQVKEWSVMINFVSVGDFVLNKLWELKYNDDWILILDSWELWINSSTKLNMNMKYASISLWEKSHLSLAQNEVWSTIFLLSWTAEVRNLVWESTVLTPGQKITISNSDANNEEIDLAILKEDLDDYFKKTDWYIKNNWDYYLSTSNTNEDIQTENVNTNISSNNNNLIVFDNLEDESFVSSSSIEITWKYFDDNITKIILNWVEANINSEEKIFSFESVDTELFENDLVFKIFDDSNDLLQKFIYVVYYKSWTDSASTWSSAFSVKTYEVDWSQFTFTSPSTTWTYTTTEWFITIRWNVLAEWIANVSVNGYTLSSFNGSTWRYHADMDYNNLKDWTNVYDIKYYDASWKVVYNNTFTIIKKEAQPTTTIEETSQTYSDEVL